MGNPTVNQSLIYESWQKGAVIEFFERRFDDIAQECVSLETVGYMTTKVFLR